MKDQKKKTDQNQPSICLPEGLEDLAGIINNMFMIMFQDFLDPWTFNQKNVMKCCKEILLPGGKQIPFCAYNNVGYREQARTQLTAQEPARRQARCEGSRFEPQPLTFSFDPPLSPNDSNGNSPAPVNGRAK